MRTFVRDWSGTVIPMVLVVSVGLAYLDAHIADLTWERPVAYLWGMCWHGLGEYALIRMAILAYSDGKHPPLLLLSFAYQKALFFMIYGSLAIFTLNLIFDGLFSWFDESMIFALFIGTTMASSVVNAVLFFGWWRGWLEEEADPIPFRPLYKWLRSRRR